MLDKLLWGGAKKWPSFIEFGSVVVFKNAKFMGIEYRRCQPLWSYPWLLLSIHLALPYSLPFAPLHLFPTSPSLSLPIAPVSPLQEE